MLCHIFCTYFVVCSDQADDFVINIILGGILGAIT